MNRINICTRHKLIDTAPELYGLFFEDINRAGDGGLYAEMIRNRAFDDGIIPQDCTYDAKRKIITSPTGWESSFDCCELEGIAGWHTQGQAAMKLIDHDTLHPNRKRALEAVFNHGQMFNDGFMGIPLNSGKKYFFYMFARSDEKVRLNVELASEAGEAYASDFFCVQGDYQRYECTFTSPVTDAKARLVFSSDDPGAVIFGFVSLFPEDTYCHRQNGLRKDLAESMIALKPAFLRFPGGCIVEGFTKETAFRFEDTIGPVWERKPHWLLWSYMTTNGLGFHEYLQFCEDADIDAMYVFNCGMTCQGRQPVYFDDDLIEAYYEDTVHAILYATAPVENEWGAKRAANGHPKPFTKLKYLEIGNENWGDEYNKRYGFFYDKLKKAFPDFIYISTDHTERAGLPTEYVDEHFYADPLFFLSNSEMYDHLRRDGIKIYCGEYASTIGVKEGTLYGALGEAAFLTGIERNQDIVRMTSYAPLFKHVDYVSWEPDLIVFNNHECYKIPSYYMLQMFAENRGDYVCEYHVETEGERRLEEGHITLENGTLIDGQAYAADVMYQGSLHIRFWDRGTAGEEQNHYDWIIENDISKVVHYNGWSAETICPGKNINVKHGLVSVRLAAHEDYLKITLDNQVIHEHTLPPVPDISAVCTVDVWQGEVIVKMVNHTEREIPLQMTYDVDMAELGELTVLTSDCYTARNSFEDPYHVLPQKKTINTSGIIHLSPRSVNVLRHKISCHTDNNE